MKLIQTIASEDLIDTGLKAVALPFLIGTYIGGATGAGFVVAYILIMAVLYGRILKKDVLTTYVFIAAAITIVGLAIVATCILLLSAIIAAK